MLESPAKSLKGAGKPHPYHLVDPSPWPLLTATSLFVLVLGGVLWMHHHTYGGVAFALGLLMLLLCLIGWWRDVVDEATFQKKHTLVVQHGLRLGVVLFIATEVMLFGAFFWSFFDASLFPAQSIGGVWPPKNITLLDPFELPYLNTLLLLLSASSLTWGHHALREGDKKSTLQGTAGAIILGFIFLCVQAYEYHHASFKISQGIYPSTFYMLTGLHGAHVLIGALFLAVCWYRTWKDHFTPTHHVGFEAAAWYWHFVDVVWLFLFIFVYWWRS